jgi:ABC-2 type transport system ATP-binding protein/lipopolysaccharide transport system ATP-binding protein
VDRIQVEGVGKRYQLGERGNLRETLTSLARRRPADRREHWSLRDVSFTVPDGGALGIVGRNGAGKSTILKILMRITAPTEGRSRTRGRVAALLEVGTGFHPELTGRENVFLNAAILGMTRAETVRRFDEIVSFAGTERFLDTPVKRYSSGMYLRLAFGVAAHLDPDVLIVDEVLAVGDAEFQRRCLGRMSEAEREGRTVVFVSHDLHSLAKLCDRTIWLEAGRVRDDGPTAQVVRDYLTSGYSNEQASLSQPATGPVRVLHVRAQGEGRSPDQALLREDPLLLTVRLEVLEERLGLDVGIVVTNERGVQVLDELLSDRKQVRFPPGVHDVVLRIPPVLNVGEYTVSVWLGTGSDELLFEPGAGAFTLFGDDRTARTGPSSSTCPSTSSPQPSSR